MRKKYYRKIFKTNNTEPKQKLKFDSCLISSLLDNLSVRHLSEDMLTFSKILVHFVLKINSAKNSYPLDM